VDSELPPYSTPAWLEARGIFCKKTWWRWAKAKKIRVVRPLGRILISRAEVERVLSYHGQLPRKEPEPDPERVLRSLKKKARSRIKAAKVSPTAVDRCLDGSPAGAGLTAGSGEAEEAQRAS